MLSRQLLSKIKSQKSQEAVISLAKQAGYSFQNSDIAFYKQPKLKKHSKAKELKLFQNLYKKGSPLGLYFKILGDQVDYFYYSLILSTQRSLFIRRVDLKWDKVKSINLKKKKTLTRFPDGLDIEERKKWRSIDERYNNPNRKKPIEDEKLAWYLKWKADVLKINPHLQPKENNS